MIRERVSSIKGSRRIQEIKRERRSKIAIK